MTVTGWRVVARDLAALHMSGVPLKELRRSLVREQVVLVLVGTVVGRGLRRGRARSSRCRSSRCSTAPPTRCPPSSSHPRPSPSSGRPSAPALVLVARRLAGRGRRRPTDHAAPDQGVTVSDDVRGSQRRRRRAPQGRALAGVAATAASSRRAAGQHPRAGPHLPRRGARRRRPVRGRPHRPPGRGRRAARAVRRRQVDPADPVRRADAARARGGCWSGEHELSTMTEADLDRFRAAEVGLVLQGAARNLLPYLTARQNVEFAQQSARKAGREVPPPGRGARAGRPRPRRHRAAGLAARRVSCSWRRSPSPWPAGPACCSATSRPPSCTTPRATSSSTRCTGSTRSGGPPSSSSPTTPRWRRGCRARSPSATAASVARAVPARRMPWCRPTARCPCRPRPWRVPARRAGAGARGRRGLDADPAGQG